MRSAVIATSLLALGIRAQQSPATWQEQSKIHGEQEECTGYSYPPVSAILETYPTTWQIADLTNPKIDPEIVALFKKMEPNIPNIPPKGSPSGEWTGNYDIASDPDCWWTAKQCTKPKLAGLNPDITECDEPKTWGFTLDDGPNCTHNAFYDFLKEKNQKATLFYIGSNVMNWPLQAQRGLADGHELAVHTWSHNYMTGLTNEQAFAELYFCKKAIKDITGVTVRSWRPPFGDIDDRIRYIAQQLDLKTVLWAEDTDDWRWVTVGKPEIESNYKNIIGEVDTTYSNTGAIVLTHEINAGMMDFVEEFLPQIQSKWTGGVMPVGVCMNDTNPYVETADFTYPNYDQWMAGTTSIAVAAPSAATKGNVLQLADVSSTGSAPAGTQTTSGGSSASASASSATATSSGIATSRSASGSSASASASASRSRSPTAASAGANQAASAKPQSGAASLSIGGGIVAAVGGVLVLANLL